MGEELTIKGFWETNRNDQPNGCPLNIADLRIERWENVDVDMG
jgi:hypothetical protein